MKKFSVSMNSNTYNNYPVTQQLIKEAIDYVREQTVMGNYEFLTLINNENKSFIQFTLQQDQYHVEIRYPDIGEGKGIYVEKSLTYEEMIDKFYDFYDGKIIDTTGYEDISYYLK